MTSKVDQPLIPLTVGTLKMPPWAVYLHMIKKDLVHIIPALSTTVLKINPSNSEVVNISFDSFDDVASNLQQQLPAAKITNI